MPELVLFDSEKIGGIFLRIALRNLRLPLEERRLALGDVIGEGAVIDQRGIVGKLIGGILEIVRRAAAEIRVCRFQALLQADGIFAELLQRRIFLLRDGSARRDARGEAHGKIPCLRDETARLKKGVVRHGQHGQSAFGKTGFPHDAGGKTVLLCGRIGVKALFKRYPHGGNAVVQIAHRSVVRVLQITAQARRLKITADRRPCQHKKGCCNKCHHSDPIPSLSYHIVTSSCVIVCG